MKFLEVEESLPLVKLVADMMPWLNIAHHVFADAPGARRLSRSDALRRGDSSITMVAIHLLRWGRRS